MDSICMPTGCEDIFAEEDSGPAWPQCLEAFRIPAEPRAAAYEGTPAPLRAALKTVPGGSLPPPGLPPDGLGRPGALCPGGLPGCAAFARPSGGGPHARHPGRCPADRGVLSWR